ncbi:hypothetical protein B0T09DRAFT_75410 [Sordaria sp. MPI-SDFR-AT-0083]|nr:hypothetical protein B0T09DRAFT_75410 [Sordaria sp. MPI-SDFR-AT-0083]
MCQGRIISYYCPYALRGNPNCPCSRMASRSGRNIPAWMCYFDQATAQCCGWHSRSLGCGDCPYNTYGRRGDRCSVYVHVGKNLCSACKSGSRAEEGRIMREMENLREEGQFGAAEDVDVLASEFERIGF